MKRLFGKFPHRLQENQESHSDIFSINQAFNYYTSVIMFLMWIIKTSKRSINARLAEFSLDV